MTIEDLRRFKIFHYAIFDLVVSFLGIYLISPLLIKLFAYFKVKTTKMTWIYLTLPMSILIHLLVGNMTQMTKDMLDLNGHYFIKILIFGLSILAIKTTKLLR